MSSPGKRKCANCRYLADAGLAGNGWCTHPKRQMSSEVRILVRKGELACRNSWGGDLWESSNGSTAANGTGQSAESSFEASIPMPRFEDQVTSVVNSDSSAGQRNGTEPATHVSGTEGRMRVPPDDQVVAQGSIETVRRGQAERPTADDVNHLAHADQHERANVMARGGPREAILRARARHRQRNAIPVRADETPLREDATAAADIVEATQGVASDDARPAHARADADAPPPVQDRLLDTRQRSPLTPAIDPFRRSYNDPAPPVPTSELPAGAEALSNRSGERNRFDSVPEVRPDIVLPRRQPPTSSTRRRAEAARQRQQGDRAAPESDVETPGARPYDRGVGKNRNIRAAAKATRDNRLNRQTPRLSLPRQSPTSPAPSDEADDSSATALHEDQESGTAHTSPVSTEVPNQTRPNVNDTAGAIGGTEAADTNRDQSPRGFDAAIDGPADEPFYFDELEDEPVTVRRRSWLTGLGRRRHGALEAGPPPTATFPLQHAPQLWTPPPERGAPTQETPSRERPSPSSTAVEEALQTDTVESDQSIQRLPIDQPEPPEPAPLSRSPRIRQFGAARPQPSEEPRPADPNSQLRGPSTPPAQMQPLRPMPSPRRHEEAQPPQPADDYDMAELRKRLFGSLQPGSPSPGDPSPRARATARPASTAPAEAAPVLEPSRAPRQVVDGTDAEGNFDEIPTVEAAPGFDLRNIMERQKDLLDMRVLLAPETPRVCRTCRSFRPSENDERGWCTNEWAFTHRRMVNAGDQPCQTSIGCWWLPDDGVWLKDDALAAFDEATPLMDQILSRYERRRVGER